MSRKICGLSASHMQTTIARERCLEIDKFGKITTKTFLESCRDSNQVSSTLLVKEREVNAWEQEEVW